MRLPKSLMLSVALGASTIVVGGATALAAAGDGVQPGGTPPGMTDRERDRALAAFERLRDQQYQAWADEDGEAFAATFTDDGDMVTMTGDHLQTRAGIAEGMQYFFDNYIDPNTIHLLDEEIDFVDPRTAVIVRTTCLIDVGETDCRDGSLSVNTNMMIRRHGDWLQRSFQNTRVIDLP